MSTKRHLAVGLVGYGAAGKSTLLQALLDSKTHLKRIKTHPTLQLCVHEAQMYQCSCQDTPCYRFCMDGNIGPEFCGHQGHELNNMILSRDVSFVDCPGKIEFASTVLGAVSMVDAILLLSAATDVVSRSSAFELVAAASVLNKNVFVIQSMVDSTDDLTASQHRHEISELIAGTLCKEPSVIPVSAWEKINIDAVREAISNMCVEEYDTHSPARMLIYNNCSQEDTESGEIILTIYGRLLKGTLQQYQQLEIRPGSVSLDEKGRPKCNPVIIKVASLESLGGTVQLQEAAAGSMVAVKTAINYDVVGHIVTDMTGFVLGDVDSLPDVFSALQIKVFILPLMYNSYTGELKNILEIKKGEELLLTIGMLSTGAKVRMVMDDNAIVVSLKAPICASKGDKIFILRRINVGWRLIGHGEVEEGKIIKIDTALHG